MGRTVWMEVERGVGDHIETRAVNGTEEEIEEFILRQANTFGTVHVLDSRGKRERTITPGEAAEKLAENR